MSEKERKKFSSKDLLNQLRQTPDLAYEFSKEEVKEGVKRFLQYVGYELMEDVYIEGEWGTKPGFHAQREAEVGNKKIRYEIVGVVRGNMNEVADGIVHLRTIKKQLGERETVDYAITVPPVQERHLIDYMVADDYKLYNDLQEEGFMLWLCNPSESSVWSAQGGPRDKRFNEYFKFKLSGGLIGMLTTMPYRSETKYVQREIMEE